MTQLTRIVLLAFLFQIILEPTMMLVRLTQIVSKHSEAKSGETLTTLRLSEKNFSQALTANRKEIRYHGSLYDIRTISRDDDGTLTVLAYKDHEETDILDVIKSWMDEDAPSNSTGIPKALKLKSIQDFEIQEIIKPEPLLGLFRDIISDFSIYIPISENTPETPPPCLS